METARLTLEPCSIEHLKALMAGGDMFERTFGLRVIDGYLEFPEALGYSLRHLESGDHTPEWASHLIIHRGDKAVIGLGGYKGAPNAEGEVEIGYGVAPAYRAQGYAREAAQAMIDHAFENDAVKTVTAHTLAEENASVAILRKCGMRLVETIHDPTDGDIWKWALGRSG